MTVLMLGFGFVLASTLAVLFSEKVMAVLRRLNSLSYKFVDLAFEYVLDNPMKGIRLYFSTFKRLPRFGQAIWVMVIPVMGFLIYLDLNRVWGFIA